MSCEDEDGRLVVIGQYGEVIKRIRETETRQHIPSIGMCIVLFDGGEPARIEASRHEDETGQELGCEIASGNIERCKGGPLVLSQIVLIAAAERLLIVSASHDVNDLLSLIVD